MRNRIHQVVAGFHRSAVHAGDDVAALESGLFRRAAGFDVHNHHAVRRTQLLQRNGIGAQLFLETDANGAARHAPLRNNLVIDADGRGGGQCEADAFISAAAGDDSGVDADHFSGQVDERTARVAGVNRRVGLQESLELVPDAADTRAIFRADDSRSDSSLQSERTANGQDPIANLHTVGVTELRRRKILVGFNLDHCQVGVFINADNFRGVLRLVAAAQLHLDLGGLLDDVIVGENVAALVDNHAGAEAALRLRRPVLAAVEEAVEKVLHRVVLIKLLLRAALLGGLALQHLRGGDVDHRRLHAIYDGGKRSSGRNRIRHGQRSGVGPGEGEGLHRRNAARHHRANQNAHGQRQRHECGSQNLAPTRPVE